MQDGHEEEWRAETVAELISKESSERRINTVIFLGCRQKLFPAGASPLLALDVVGIVCETRLVRLTQWLALVIF